MKIKLTEKQLELLNNIQKQKQEMQRIFQEVVNREATALELIYDMNGLTETPTKVELEGENLVLTLPEKEKVKKLSQAKRPITDPD